MHKPASDTAGVSTGDGFPMSSELRQALYFHLTTHDLGLVGCHRRNAWHAERGDALPWRKIAGNAYLETIADRRTIELGPGTLECYLTAERFLCTFHGGHWGFWVVNDAFDLWSLIRASEQVPDLSHRIYVLHEMNGNLDIKQVDVPEDYDWAKRAEDIFTSYYSTPAGRIPKSGARAVRYCPWCPFKQRCDAYDVTHQQTDDWSPNYPIP